MGRTEKGQRGQYTTAAQKSDIGTEKSCCISLMKFVRLLAMGSSENSQIPRKLTPRQITCTSMALQGMSGQEIAKRLILSVHTVYCHLETAYQMQPELVEQVRQARASRKGQQNESST